MALSVLSMPPMTVASANGSATDSAPHVSPSASSQASVGQGIARRHSPGAIRTWLPGRDPGPALHRVDRAPHHHGREGAGHAAGQRDPPDEGDEDQPEREESHQRVRDDLEHGQEGDQEHRDARDRAEQPRARHDAPHPLAGERQGELGDAHGHGDAHADLPGEHGVPRREHRRAQDAERRRRTGTACRSRRASRSRRARPVSPHQPHGRATCSRGRPPAPRAPFPGRSGRARDRRGSRTRRPGGRQHDQVREVVDGEAEERVHVAGRVPAVRGRAPRGFRVVTDFPAPVSAPWFRVRSGSPASRPAPRPSAGGGGGGEELPGAWPERARRAPRTTRSASAPRRPRGSRARSGASPAAGRCARRGRGVSRRSGPRGRRRVEDRLDARALALGVRADEAREPGADLVVVGGDARIHARRVAVIGPRPPRAPVRTGGVTVAGGPSGSGAQHSLKPHP